MSKHPPPVDIAKRLTYAERMVLLDVCRRYALSKRPSLSEASNNVAYHALVNRGLLNATIAVGARLYSPTSYGKQVCAQARKIQRER